MKKTSGSGMMTLSSIVFTVHNRSPSNHMYRHSRNHNPTREPGTMRGPSLTRRVVMAEVPRSRVGLGWLLGQQAIESAGQPLEREQTKRMLATAQQAGYHFGLTHFGQAIL